MYICNNVIAESIIRAKTAGCYVPSIDIHWTSIKATAFMPCLSKGPREGCSSMIQASTGSRGKGASCGSPYLIDSNQFE